MAADVAPRHAEVLAGMAAGTIGVSAGARFLGPDVLRTRYHRTYQRIMRPGHQGNQLPGRGPDTSCIRVAADAATNACVIGHT